MFARTLGHLSCVLLPAVAGFAQAQPIEPTTIDRATIDPAGVPGALLLGGGGRLPAAIYERFLELAGGADARIVLVPTASARADEPGGLERTLETWRRDHPGVHFDVLHTRDRSTADREDFTAPLRAATGVWFGGGAQERLAAAYAGTRVEHEVLHLLARGGIVGGSSAGTAIQTRTMIQEGKDPPVLATGLPLLPFAISDQHFTQRQRLPRLLEALRLAEGHFGIGVDEGTAALVRGRRIEVLGDHTVTLALAARNGRDERVVTRKPGEGVDLVAWQRAARDRAGPGWPPPASAERTPGVAAGSLVLAGGGALTDDIVQHFVELAGGAERAVIVLVPSATGPLRGAKSGEPLPLRDPIERRLRALGVRDVRTIAPLHPRDVTPAHVAALAEATGVWFGGGRQWRLVDACEGTPLLDAFHQVLARGGAIGGTSAGATIQAEYLVRGNPDGNQEMWCEGYARGFGFLRGCAVDQHFVARHREEDLRQLVRRFPQIVGLGIDEGTAAVVRGETLTVVGTSKVAIVRGAGAELRWLGPGESAPLGSR
jgi:cyanophycinase